MRRRARELAMRALFAHTVGGMGLEEAFQHALEAVSYTHLTLPTILLV